MLYLEDKSSFSLTTVDQPWSFKERVYLFVQQ